MSYYIIIRRYEIKISLTFFTYKPRLEFHRVVDSSVENAVPITIRGTFQLIQCDTTSYYNSRNPAHAKVAFYFTNTETSALKVTISKLLLKYFQWSTNRKARHSSSYFYRIYHTYSMVSIQTSLWLWDFFWDPKSLDFRDKIRNIPGFVRRKSQKSREEVVIKMQKMMTSLKTSKNFRIQRDFYPRLFEKKSHGIFSHGIGIFFVWWEIPQKATSGHL